ncbi:MAG: DNA polymerase III subunit alpha, partial [Oscillospiraceae bacterium]
TVECTGCVANGISASIANEIFDEMSSFASYAFNKSHAAAYAFVSYQTAWLKCHYPKEYMAALLTSVLDNTDKVVSYKAECERLGLKILPPDVCESEEGFTVTDGGIRFGLLAIKSIGKGFVHRLLERRAQAPFESFWNFCTRMYDADLRRRTAETLIKAGAFDCFGDTRRALMESCGDIIEEVERTEKANLAGQMNLFDTAPQGISERFSVPPQPEYESSQLLKMEKEVLGLYASGHPLAVWRERIAALPVVPIADIQAAGQEPTGQLHDDAPVAVAAVVSTKKLVVTKKGETMAYLTVEDL